MLSTDSVSLSVSPLPRAPAGDAGVLAALRSEELRRLVRLIDAAPDGEAVRALRHSRAFARKRRYAHAPRAAQALEAAMQQPRFAAFADTVLAALRGGAA